MDLKIRINRQNRGSFIMKKVSKNDLIAIEKELEYYDFEELSPEHQKQWLIRFKKSVNEVTYSDLQYGGDEVEYNKKEEILLKLLYELFMMFKGKYCIIKKYEERWVIDNKLSEKLYNVLKNQQITTRFAGGILVEKDSEVIKLFAESVFKYNSFIQYIFSDEKIVVSPSDHLDIFIASNNIKALECKILGCINNVEKEMLELIER